MATASSWLWNFLIWFSILYVTGDVDFAYGYAFAGCICRGVGCFTLFVLESKGKTLEEMDMMYIMRVRPWESSKWVPPPPEVRVTTANVLDQRAARDLASDEESNKRNQGPAHQHIDQNEAGVGPSAYGVSVLACITRGSWFGIFCGSMPFSNKSFLRLLC